MLEEAFARVCLLGMENDRMMAALAETRRRLQLSEAETQMLQE